MKEYHYINLTNGIEAIPQLGDNYHFVRIQSTACEQKRWNFILQDLDIDLLMNLALGQRCLIYDYGHCGMPRALWQGIEFIRYSLSRFWLSQFIKPIMRNGHNASSYFNVEYCKLSNRTFQKLNYFKKFLRTNHIQLIVKGEKTVHDGKYEWYRKQLENNSTGGKT